MLRRVKLSQQKFCSSLQKIDIAIQLAKTTLNYYEQKPKKTRPYNKDVCFSGIEHEDVLIKIK